MHETLTKAALLARLSASAATHKQPLLTQPSEEIPQASVLVPIIDANPLAVLFTERTAHLKHHASQISFPGGRREVSDSSLEVTCLRETHEEIGVSPEQISIITSLPPLISSSGFLVTPFVGLVSNSHTLQIDPLEVASVFSVPLDYLLDPARYRSETILYRGRPTEIFIIDYQHYRIWGLTAKIIVDLAAKLRT